MAGDAFFPPATGEFITEESAPEMVYFFVFQSESPVSQSLVTFIRREFASVNQEHSSEALTTPNETAAAGAAGGVFSGERLHFQDREFSQNQLVAFTEDEQARIIESVESSISEKEFSALPEVRRRELQQYLLKMLPGFRSTVPGAELTEEDWDVKLEDIRLTIRHYKSAKVFIPEKMEEIARQLEIVVEHVAKQIGRNVSDPVAERVRRGLQVQLAQLTNSSLNETFKSTINDGDLQSLLLSVDNVIADCEANGHLSRDVSFGEVLAHLGTGTIRQVYAAFGGRERELRALSNQLKSPEDAAHQARMREVFMRERERQKERREKRYREFVDGVAAEHLARKTMLEEERRAREESIVPLSAGDRPRSRAFWTILVLNAGVLIGLVIWRTVRRSG